MTATVAIASGTVAVSPATAAITMTETQQYTVAGGGTFNWTVDGIAGGNNTVGLISANGLYTTTTATAAGTHRIQATNAGNPGLTGSAVAAVTDLTGVYTYHNDNARDGANTHEYALTDVSVQSGAFGKIAACAVDGAVYAQPLWVANLVVAGARHNVVFVATAHDSLYAFDADAATCTVLWSAGLIDANHGGTGGETSVPGGPTGYLVGQGDGDISPEVGVIGTPVIDPASGTLYVVSKSVNAGTLTFHQRLHAIDITSGNEKTGSPVAIAGTYNGTGDGGSIVTFNPRNENQRPGLALVNGIVYVAWGSHEDAAPWYGWMMGYTYSGSGFNQTAVLNVSPNAHESGIWLSGGAPAVDAANNLYIATGNGTFDATNGTAPNNDYGDSLLQLTSSLTVAQTFTPSNQLTDFQGDADFGAGGLTVLPDLPASSVVPRLVVAGDKEGEIFLINRDILGGYQNILPVQKISTGRKFFGTGAYWNNQFYIGAAFGPMFSFTLDTSDSILVAGPTSSHFYGFPGSTPSVSAAGTQNGLVWSLDNTNYCTRQSPGCGPAVLYAFDATNVQNPLWTSPASGAGAAGYAVKFSVPTIANGRVFVGTRGNNTGGVDASTSVPGELDIFGLSP